jgi:hypothetical protein
MDEIIALRVELANEQRRFFLTWGRLADPVDPTSLIDIVQPQLRRFALGGDIARVEVCATLQDAATAPYFYEALFHMCQQKIPYGEGYERWAAETLRKMRDGGELYYLGEPRS